MRRALRAAALGATAVVLASCAEASTSYADYRHKVSNTASAVVSALQTAYLASAHAPDDGYVHFVETSVGNADDDAASAADTFDTTQPPDDRRADALHDDFDAVLQQAGSLLDQMRVEARRGHLAALTSLAARIPDLVQRLQRFEELA